MSSRHHAARPPRASTALTPSTTHGAQSPRDDSAIDAIPITDQVARGLSPRECLSDLACDPFRGRIGRDVDPDKVSAGQPDDDEDIEQIEANGWNNDRSIAAMSGA
jgi:hypothetical protein